MAGRMRDERDVNENTPHWAGVLLYTYIYVYIYIHVYIYIYTCIHIYA